MSNTMDTTQLMIITSLMLGIFCCMSTSAEERNSTNDRQLLSRERRDGYHHEHYHYRHKHRCYQCSYSPPKHVYQHEHYGYGGHGGAGGGGGGGGFGGGHGHGHGSYGHSHSHYLNGGWEKCLGPFDHYQAEAHGIDTWDCHYNNCYVRKDPNGDIFRGCYKGEYDVDPYKLGCHPQGGSIYCFCEGELCNNGEVGYHYH